MGDIFYKANVFIVWWLILLLNFHFFNIAMYSQYSVHSKNNKNFDSRMSSIKKNGMFWLSLENMSNYEIHVLYLEKTLLILTRRLYNNWVIHLSLNLYTVLKILIFYNMSNSSSFLWVMMMYVIITVILLLFWSKVSGGFSFLFSLHWNPCLLNLEIWDNIHRFNRVTFLSGPGFLTSYVVIFFYIQWVDVRGNCSCYWYW